MSDSFGLPLSLSLRALAWACLCALAWPFPLGCAHGQALAGGPVVGALLPTSAIIWVRLDLDALVAIEYAPVPTPANGWVRTTASNLGLNNALKFALTGLQPNTQYEYWVIANGARLPYLAYGVHYSGPARFRTAPIPGDSVAFRALILTDFSNINNPPAGLPPVLSSGAVRDASFFIILGDFDHRNPQSLSAARTMRRENYDCSHPWRASLCVHVFWQMGGVITWDDHDYCNNNSDKSCGNRANAFQVYDEFVPHYPFAVAAGGITQEFIWGQSQFLLLDNRYWRDPNSDTDNASKSMLDGDALGGTGQKQWLKDRLIAGNPVWRVLLSGSPFNRTFKTEDGWAAFTTEFDELKAYYLANQSLIKGLFSVGGDLHATAADIASSLGKASFIGPPYDSDGCDTGPQGLQDLGCPQCDETVGSSLPYPQCHGYAMLDFRTHPNEMRWRATSHDGRATFMAHRLNWP